jgi:hypothetical protein
MRVSCPVSMVSYEPAPREGRLAPRDPSVRSPGLDHGQPTTNNGHAIAGVSCLLWTGFRVSTPYTLRPPPPVLTTDNPLPTTNTLYVDPAPPGMSRQGLYRPENRLYCSTSSRSRTSRARAWSSFTSTLNDSGRPASRVLSPLTTFSYIRVLPATSSDFTVRNSCKAWAAP